MKRSAVFTAIDGALLDGDTFDAGRNRAAIARLQASGVPVVAITVMTFEEVAPIAASLGLRDPMVVEAGGAIARCNDGCWHLEPCGPAAETMLDVIREIEDRAGADLVIYSAMPAQLARSSQRMFSEPFVIERGSVNDVMHAASELGFSVRRGRRFFHLCRDCDEGASYARICRELRSEFVVAFGGSPLDAEFLSRADLPVIVPGKDGLPDAELLERVPHARIAPAPAPGGWLAMIDSLWPEIVSAQGRRPMTAAPRSRKTRSQARRGA